MQLERLKFSVDHNLHFKVTVGGLAAGFLYMSGLFLFFYFKSHLTLTQIIIEIIPASLYCLLLAVCYGALFLTYTRFKKLNECLNHYFIENLYEKFDRSLEIDNNIDLIIKLRQLYDKLIEVVDHSNFCLSIQVSIVSTNILEFILIFFLYIFIDYV